MSRLKLVEEIVSIGLSTQQKNLFEKLVEEAKAALTSKGEWRYEVAELAIKLHNECFGEKTRWNVPESRVVRTLFAREIGQSIRTVENWMEVKKFILDELPEERTKNLAYVNLVETLYLLKNKNLTAKQALDKYLSRRQDPTAHRMSLILKYSLNVLNSVRKFNLEKCDPDDLALARERLQECLERLR